MGKRNNHILRNAMFVVALLAVVAVCFVNLSSDEYADPIELKDGENTVATYELVGNTLTITAKSDYYSVSSIPDITGIDKTSVHTIYLENFLNQGVSSVFNKETYENLVDIHYKGTIDLSSTVVDYDFDITDSSLELSTSSLNCVLPDYELESTSPFSTYFFSSLAESIVLKGFQSGGANIFNCFTKVLSFHATDYNVINANLLNGLSSVNTLKFDSLNLDDNPSTDKKEAADFASAVKDTLVTVELASATDIGAYAFNNYTKLQSLIAPKLENIGSYAFNNADRLNVNFTDYPNLESIGGYAFANCGGLGDLVFPSKIKIIGSWAFNFTSLTSVSFANCTSLTQICGGAFGKNGNLSGALVLPDSLIYLGDYTVGNIKKDNDTQGTFWGSQITSVTCGPNLLKVDQHSFWECTKLTTVRLPASLEYIGSTSFIRCTSLTDVYVDGTSLKSGSLSVSTSAFDECKNLSTFVSPTITNIHNIFSYSSALKTLIVPSVTSLNPSEISHLTDLQYIDVGLNSVPENMFKGMSQLKTVILKSESGISIGANAFNGCSSLITITSGQITSLGTHSFYGCTKLSAVNFGIISLVQDSTHVFYGCESLTSINVDSLSSIPESMFEGCKRLTTVSITGAEAIGNNAFSGCKALTNVDLLLVTSVGDYAFFGCESYAVSDLSKVASIGEYAFSNCTSIKSVMFGNITAVPAGVFSGCTGLTSISKGISTPLDLVTIGTDAFSGCTSLTNVGNLDNIQTIGDMAFYNCKVIGNGYGNSIELPTITSIGKFGFAGCTSITSFSLGDNLTTLGDRALNNANLVSVTIGAKSPQYKVENGIVFNKSGTLILCPANLSSFNANDSSYTIPPSVTVIAPYAFEYSNLNAVSFQSSNMLVIGEYAFSKSSIGGILEFKEGTVKSVGDFAFESCENITGLNFACSPLYGWNVFDGCTEVESVTLPITTQFVKDGIAVFDVSSNIVSYEFIGNGPSGQDGDFFKTYYDQMPWYYPADYVGEIKISVRFTGVTVIDPYMFAADPEVNVSRVESVTMSDSVVEIGCDAFYGCSILTTLRLSNNLDDGDLKDLPFEGCVSVNSLTAPISLDFTELGQIMPLQTLNLTSGVKFDWNYTQDQKSFLPWYGLQYTCTVTLDDGIARVPDHIYLPASGEFNTPNSLEYVGIESFCGSGITSLTLNDGLVTLGHRAFADCGSLDSVVLNGDHLLSDPTSKPFQGCERLTTLTLPITLDYSKPLFDGCTGITTIKFVKGTNGVGHNYTPESYKSTPWYTLKGSKKLTISFADDIVYIGSNMFRECYSKTELSMYGFVGGLGSFNGLTGIGSYAFYGCEGITGSLTFPEDFETIGSNAFQGCTGLTGVTFNGVETIGDYAFHGCRSITGTIPFPDTLTNIGSYAFFGITGITGISFNEVETIGAGAFHGCIGLDGTITFPDTLTNIGDDSFRGCSGVDTFVFGANLKTIGAHAFMDCTSITQVSISPVLTNIGAGAFTNCSGLKTLTLPIHVDAVRNESDPIFKNCDGITTVTFKGDGVTNGHPYTSSNYDCTPWYYSREGTVTVSFDANVISIGSYMFYDCAGVSIESLELGNGINSVGDYAFHGVNNLPKLSILKKTVSLGNGAFESCGGLTTLQLPIDKDVHTSKVFVGCVNISSIKFTGNGDASCITYTSSDRDMPWVVSNVLCAVSFDSSVKAIGEYMFYDCDNISIAGFTVGNGIDTVGAHAFHGATKLSSLVIVSTPAIGENAFEGCDGIVNLTIPLGYDLVTNNLFNDCDGLTQVHFTGGTGFKYSSETVKLTPWYQADNPCSISFAENISSSSIGDYMFYDCGKISGDVDLNNLPTIGDYAFHGCVSIEDVDASGVSFLGTHAFEGCSGMTSIRVTSLSEVKPYTFAGCEGLKIILFGNLYAIGDYAFYGSGFISTHEGGEESIELNNVTSIGEKAFATSGIKIITIGTGNVPIGSLAFSECPVLNSITINSNGTIPFDAFRSKDVGFDSSLVTLSAPTASYFNAYLEGFTKLTTVNIPSAYISDTTVGMFRGCTSLNSVNVSDLKMNLPQSAFEGCESLTSIDADGFNLVKGREFYGCKMLNDITLTCTTIASESFSGCVALSDIVAKEVTSIGDRAFYGSGLVSFFKQNISDTEPPVTVDQFPKLTSVGDYVFANSKSLASVDHPGLINIGIGAFEGCIGLGSVSLPGVGSIPASTFSGCVALTDVSMDTATSIGVLAFNGCSSLQSIVLNNVNSVGSVSNDPMTVDDRIKYGVFTGCLRLSSVTMGQVTSIGDFAFYGCSGLKSFNSDRNTLDLSDVVSVGYYAFYNSIAEAVIVGDSEDGVNIGDLAFSGCNSLTGFTIVGGIKSIGPNVLYNSNNVENLSLPIASLWISDSKIDGIKSITFTKGNDTQGCDYSGNHTNVIWYGSANYDVTFEDGITKLGSDMYLSAKGTVGLPASLTSIGSNVFSGAPLDTVTFKGTNVESIGEGAFSGCTNLQSITIPISVKSIGDSAFGNCTNLTTITLPINVDYSGDVFRGCNSLTGFIFTSGSGTNSGKGIGYDGGDIERLPWYFNGYKNIVVTFDTGVTSIGSNMFKGCIGLRSPITLPDTVVSVGECAFEGTENLPQLHILSTGNLTLGKHAFNGCKTLNTLTLPISVNTVVNHDQPAFDGCTRVSTINFIGTTSHHYYDVSDPGYDSGSDYTKTPWYLSRGNSIRVSFDDTVTSIGNNMFRDCGGLDGYIDHSNLKVVGSNAFRGCTSLDGFNAGSLQTLGGAAFYGCASLTNANLGSITSLPDHTFYGCTMLNSVTMNSCISIGAGAFELSGIMYVNSNAGVSLSNVTTIGARAFARSSVRDVNIVNDDNVTLIMGDEVFFECPNLTKLVLKCNLTEFPVNTLRTNGDMDFKSNLEILTIPKVGSLSVLFTGFDKLREVDISSVTYFNATATTGMFKDCVNLEEVKLYKGEMNIKLPGSAFENCENLSTIELDKVLLSNLGRDFYGCSSLESVTLSVAQAVPAEAFYGCSSLQTITAPSVTSIDVSAFAYSGITSISEQSFPIVETISASAFEHCTALTDVNLKKAHTIGKNVFRGCTILDSFTAPELLTIDTGTFYECITLSDVSVESVTLVKELSFYKCTSLKSIDLPSVTDIGDTSSNTSVTLNDHGTKAVFYNCSTLASITMGKIKNIGALAFYGCSSLSSINDLEDDGRSVINLPNVATIRFGAFAESAAYDVVIGNSSNGIKDIGDYAFYACQGLNYFSSPSLTALPSHLFNDVDVESKCVVPQLKRVDVPKVGNFEASLHGCNLLTYVNAPSAIKFITGAFYGCTKLETVILAGEDSPNVVRLSTQMFSGCESLWDINLDRVEFDGRVDHHAYADTFRGCESLTSIELPIATIIPSGAFYGCDSISDLYAPNAVTVGSDAFYGCTDLESIHIPNAVTIMDRAFRGCGALSDVNTTTGLSPFVNISNIGVEAFYGCALESLVLGPRLTHLGEYCFANNPLTEVVIPNSTNGEFTIPEAAFQYCPIEELHISSSVREIQKYAFDYSDLGSVTEVDIWFNGSVSLIDIDEAAFVGTRSMVFNVHADTGSKNKVESFVSNGQFSNTNVMYDSCYTATVKFSVYQGLTPVILSATAVYGGKIVLPTVISGDAHLAYHFAVMDNKSNYLSMFVSEADFANERVARSGDAVPIYPLVDREGMDIYADVSDEYFTDVMSIVSEPKSGVDLDVQDNIHYGSIVRVPSFIDPLLKVNGVIIKKMDGTTYELADISTKEFRAGYYLMSISIVSQDMVIDVVFNKDGVDYEVEVKLQSKFDVPIDLKYLETPAPGYRFGGWWSYAGGNGIMAGDNTKFAVGQVWYAHFIPVEYTVTVETPDSNYKKEFTLTGPYVLQVVNNSLYYEDLLGDGLLFDAKTVPGYSVKTYIDGNNRKPITGDYEPTPANMKVELYLTENIYTVKLEFQYEGSQISEDVPFNISGWSVGNKDGIYHSGSVVSDIPYNVLSAGLAMPIPIHDVYAFSEMVSSYGPVSYVSGKYILSPDNFGDGVETTITFVMQKGVYTVQFLIGDDASTKYDNFESVTIGDRFMMPSVQYKYFKTGFVFDHFEIKGMGGDYSEIENVTLTQEMTEHAEYCVITVEGVWVPITYTIGFDVNPFNGTVADISDVIVGDTITMPVVSGYAGYRVSGWHWSNGGSVSDTFIGPVELTQDIIASYSVDNRIILKAEWVTKTYTFEVDPSTGYKFETKTATFGDDITLWTNTYSRSFMKFAGWAIGSTVYKDSSTVRVDTIMAAAGDANNDRVVFSMSWIDNEYQVQYNLDGGEGQIPVDDNAYVVNKTEFKLPEYTEDFYQDGYTFIGWKYSKNSYIVYTNTTGLFETVLAQYADENNIVTFYAVWSQKSYKISYDLAGGRAGLNSPTNVFYGDVVNISTPTRAGYDFTGWTATGLTGGALYSSSAGYRGWDGVREVTSTSFMDLCNQDGGVVTFTAHWDRATYLISHHLNGGSGAIISDQIVVSVGEVIRIPDLRDAFKTGYRYVGWGVDPYNALEPGSTFTTDMITGEGNTLVLYAIWTPVEYTVQYKYIDSHSYTTIRVEFQEVIPLPIIDRAGYTFNGWHITGADLNAYYSKDGSTWYKLGTTNVEGTYFKNLTSVDGGVVTLDASWSTNEYRISYNANGGTGKVPTDSNVYKVGDSIQLQDYTVLSGTNGSKSIVGWSLDPNGSSVSIVEFTEGLAMRADATGSINLYAVWVDGMCTVIVDLGDATVSSIPAGWIQNANGTYEKIVDYGTETANVMKDWTKVTVEKDGYNFLDWSYTSATITSTVTVTPEFEEVNMTILYAFGGVIAAFAIGAIFFTRL